MLSELYRLRAGFRQWGYLLSLLSNLGLDYAITEGTGQSVLLYLGYKLSTIRSRIELRPITLVHPAPLAHKRYLLLHYIGSQTLSLGGFDAGRVSGIVLEETSETASLVPHLDVRGRRVVVDEHGLGKVIPCKHWFTFIAPLAGVHRWGFAWRRCIASSLAAYTAVGLMPYIGDIRLLAASVVEFIFNRAKALIAGEERYLHPEAYTTMKAYMNLLRSVIERTRVMPVSDAITLLADSLNQLHAKITAIIRREVYYLAESLRYAALRGVFREVYVPCLLTGVYFKLLGPFVELIEGALRLDGRRRVVVTVFATETWSPMYTLYYVMRVLEATRARLDRGLRPPSLLILYTPQTLPQVVFSIMALKDLAERPRAPILADVEAEVKEEVPCESTKPGKLTHINVRINFDRGVRLAMEVIPVPIIGKQALPVYQSVVASLISAIETLEGGRASTTVLYHPELSGILPVLAALKRISIQGTGTGIDEIVSVRKV